MHSGLFTFLTTVVICYHTCCIYCCFSVLECSSCMYRWVYMHNVQLSIYDVNLTKSSFRLQVLTRFLFSSSPILYWISAIVVSDSLSLPPSPPSSYSLSLLIRTLITQIVCTNRSARVSSSNQMARCIVLYFLAYILLGFLLHCNFYPWT